MKLLAWSIQHGGGTRLARIVEEISAYDPDVITLTEFRAKPRVQEPFLFVGDWNTGAHRLDETSKTFVCAEHFGRLSTLGWTDVWRHHNPGITECTWGSGSRRHAVGPPCRRRITLSTWERLEDAKGERRLREESGGLMRTNATPEW